MNKALIFCLIVMPCDISVSGEIVVNEELGMVKESYAEEVRKNMATAFGELEEYDYILISPERIRFASALKRKDDNSYALLYWRPGMEATVKGNVNKADIDSMMDNVFDRIEKPEKDDVSQRVFLFKKIRNMDDFDWVSIAIRIGDNSEDVKTLMKILVPVTR